MSGAEHAHAESHEAGPFALRTYLIGFVLSVVLTAIPFWMVMSGAVDNRAIATALIVALAVAQIVVHTFAFLHVNTRVQGGWTLVAYVFTVVFVVIIIAGSVWIMLHLNTNMMPGLPGGSMSQMP
ncbi:MAG: cytochrome o ubiquinol oxidase subunit IV [Proteobacteria bacterium]|nr:MAG: cytochrome o ubiquinol oxidase subunit IV [Pseudomonadota bacterium]